MKGLVIRISLAVSLLTFISLVGALPARSDSSRSQLDRQSEDRATKRHAQPGVQPLSYRSPGGTHKLIVPSDDPELEQRLLSSRAVRKLKKYDHYSVVEVGDAELGSLDANTLERARLRDDLNLVMLKRGQIDTTVPEPEISAELRQQNSASRGLHLVQLLGPPTPESVR